LLLAVLTAAFAWNPALTDTGELASGARLYLWGGLIGGFVLAMATVFKKRWAPVSAPLLRCSKACSRARSRRATRRVSRASCCRRCC